MHNEEQVSSTATRSETNNIKLPQQPSPRANRGSRMEGAALRRWDTSSSQYSFRTSVSTAVDIGGSEADEDVEETSPRPVDDRVFVAVPEDVRHGKSTLRWALENPAKDGARVVVAYVHCPAQMIPMMGAKVHYTTVNQQRVSDHRKAVRAEADAKLDAYVLMCRRLKVSCKKIVIDNDKVAEGLEEFVGLHGVTKLVMGAAADKHYSKKMETPKSKTALRLMEAVGPSCKIWLPVKDTSEQTAGKQIQLFQQKIHHLLQVLQTENEKLQQERDTAVATAAGLRQRSDHKVSVPLPAEALNTEFSSFELEEATRGFDQALKIGEGGFGSVYRGFLRNTTVAVKLLHPESISDLIHHPCLSTV